MFGTIFIFPHFHVLAEYLRGAPQILRWQVNGVLCVAIFYLARFLARPAKTILAKLASFRPFALSLTTGLNRKYRPPPRRHFLLHWLPFLLYTIPSDSPALPQSRCPTPSTLVPLVNAARTRRFNNNLR